MGRQPAWMMCTAAVSHKLPLTFPRTGRSTRNPYAGFTLRISRQDVRQPNQHGNVLIFICRLSAIWSAARVCRHGWFDSKGGFLYSRSSIGRALVSKTKGCRLGPCRECQTGCSCGGRRSIGIAGHLAAKVPDAAAPTPFELIFTNRMCGGMHGCCLFLIKRQKLYKYANLCRKPPKMTLHNTEKIV